ncbi:OTU-like cysteine protease [Cryptosporidium meleagridis]
MDSDSQESKPSRRKVLQRQSQEVKALKEQWKKALTSCNKKGSKKELDKEYQSKMEALQLSHKMELMKLSEESSLENEEDSLKQSSENNRNIDDSNTNKLSFVEKFQILDEVPSLYSNATFQVTKSEKRKKKKQKELEQKYMKSLQECSLNNDRKGEIELEVINKKLKENNLKIFNISADGNCLFGSIKHQLEIKKKGSYSIKELRCIAVDYIESNRKIMEPFVLASVENTDITFEKYCDNIRNTNEWGGEVELVALSNSLEVPITVIRALNHRNESYGEQFYEEYEDEENNVKENTLYIVYHVHLFANGPHYNSTISI